MYCAAQMVAAQPTLVLVAMAAALPAALGLSNAVVQWQNATEQVVRDFNVSNQVSARYYALVNIAQYQALLANDASGKNLNSTAVTGTADLSGTLPAAMPCACKGHDRREADVCAAAFAAHYILAYFFPFRSAPVM